MTPTVSFLLCTRNCGMPIGLLPFLLAPSIKRLQSR
jgi:hypothetical protein